MSSGSIRHDRSGEAAAYVLGALEPAEAEAFRQHLATCVVCRDEVAALSTAADVLPLAAPQYATPRGLRRRVLAEVRTDARRQQRPSRRRPAASVRPAFAAAVVAAVVAAAIGIAALASGGIGTRVIPARVAVAAASAQVRLSGGRGELVVRNLPAPPAGHIYEVWLQRGHGAPSPTETLFSVTSQGAGEIGLPGNLKGVSAVLVTPEPAGGSLAPTHAPVIVAQLT